MGCMQSQEVVIISEKKYHRVFGNRIDKASIQDLVGSIKSKDLILFGILADQKDWSPNTQLSIQDSFWMATHYACMHDSPMCLEYVLKEAYANRPTQYISYVNQTTKQGYTCLHLCAIFNSQKCFAILQNFGGLNLSIEDETQSNALAVATEYKRDWMIKILRIFIGANQWILPINHQRINQSSLQMFSDKNYDSENAKLTENQSLGLNLAGKIFSQQFSNTMTQTKNRKKQIQNDRTQIVNQQKRLFDKKKTQQQQLRKKMEEEADKNQQQIKEEVQFIYEKKDAQEEQLQNTLNNKNKQIRELNSVLEQEKRRELQKAIEKERQEAQKYEDKVAQNHQQEREKRRSLLQEKKRNLNQTGEYQKRKTQHLQTNFDTGNLNKMSLHRGQIPQQFNQLYKQAKMDGKFIDRTFPATQETISKQNSAKREKLCKDLVWLRPEQIFKRDYQLFDGINPNDIKQGSLGVCYYLATLSAIAANPKQIQRMFVFHDKPVGFYVLRFYLNGKREYIVVDDQIPCNKRTEIPLFSKPIGNEIWVCLLQKAWAKAVGSYLSAEAMTPDQVMEDLVAAPAYGSWFKDEKGDKTERMLNNLQCDHIVVLSSKPANQAKIKGITNNHAYTLLKGIEHNNERIFKIRNPWGHYQWEGKYGDKSSLLTQELKTKLDIQEEDDGIFLMTQPEFLNAFCYYSVGMIKRDFYYNYIEVESKYKQDLFYTFTLNSEAEINIRLTQLFQRMVADSNYQYSSMMIVLGKIEDDGTVTLIDQGNKRSYFGAKSVHITEDLILKYSRGKYFIRLRLLWVDQAKFNKAILSTYANCQIDFVKIKDREEGIKYWKQLMKNVVAKKRLSSAGNMQYAMEWMKGQLVCYGHLKESSPREKVKIRFVFDLKQLQNAELDLERVGTNTLQFQIGKGHANGNVGTISKKNLSDGCATGQLQVKQIPI